LRRRQVFDKSGLTCLRTAVEKCSILKLEGAEGKNETP
jgi:hypothetical protein